MTNAIITAYCACRICCGPGPNPTASGTRPRPAHTIAAPRSVPFGTKVKIDGRIYTVEDRTSMRYDGRWDIFMRSHRAAKQFGIQTNKIQILP